MVAGYQKLPGLRMRLAEASYSYSPLPATLRKGRVHHGRVSHVACHKLSDQMEGGSPPKTLTRQRLLPSLAGQYIRTCNRRTGSRAGKITLLPREHGKVVLACQLG